MSTKPLWSPCATVTVSGSTVMLKSGPVERSPGSVSRIVAVCESVPDVPTKLTCTGVGVAGAVLAAARVTTTGLFGLREICAGEAVTPLGRLFTAIEIVPPKLPRPMLLSVTLPLAPGISISVAGDAASMKSPLVGGVMDVTVSATVACSLCVPEVPTNVTCAGVAVAGASLAAVRVTTTGLFGLNEIVEGDAVTPVGRSFTAIAIVPLKLPLAVLLSVTCPLAPGVSVSVVGAAVTVNSPLPGGFVAVTVSATEVFALRVPDEPYTFTVLVPTAASAAAVSVNVVLDPIATDRIRWRYRHARRQATHRNLNGSRELIRAGRRHRQGDALPLRNRQRRFCSQREGAAIGRAATAHRRAATGNQRNQTKAQQAKKGNSHVTHTAPGAGTLFERGGPSDHFAAMSPRRLTQRGPSSKKGHRSNR